MHVLCCLHGSRRLTLYWSHKHITPDTLRQDISFHCSSLVASSISVVTVLSDHNRWLWCPFTSKIILPKDLPYSKL